MKQIVKAMAREKVREGHTNAADIVDAIHADIAPHSALWKNEIADIIAESGHGKPRTKDDLQYTYAKLQKELRGPKDPVAERSAARVKQIDKQLADIEQRLKTGDFKKEPRAKPEYNEEARAKQADLERARRAVQREIQRIGYESQSRIQKGADFGASALRTAILSSPGVIEHLAGASFWRLASTLVEDTAGSALRAIPALRKYSDLAPVEGGGFLPSAHANGLQAIFSKQTLKDMYDKIRKGASERGAIYGKDHHTNHPWMDIVGKIHDVIKTPIERYAFARAYERQTVNMRRNLKQSGKSEAEINQFMALDSTDAQFSARAYAESQRAKLQGDNAVAQWLNGSLSRLEKSGEIGAVTSAILRTEMPIVKIPLNYASEFASYAGGGALALNKIRQVKRMGGEISPETADYIVRNLKKQAVGPALYALGYIFSGAFGGLYQEGKKPGKIKTGDANIGGFELSHHITHSPAWGVIQAGATARHAEADDRKKGYGKVAQILDGAAQANLAMLLDVPVFDLPKDLSKMARGGTSTEKFLGSKVAQFIPGALQWEARREDVDSHGEPVKRKPRGFVDELRLGIPGLRKNVPRG